MDRVDPTPPARPPARRRHLLWLLLVVLLAWAWQRGVLPPVPDRYDPWAPLDLRQPPDWFFRFKFARMAADPAACRGALVQAGARFSPVRDWRGPGNCGWTDAVRLRATGNARLVPSAVLSCPLAASMVLIDRHVLQRSARALFGLPVTRIEHVGSYACRTIDRIPGAAPSSHSRAEAIDLTGFVLGDGRALRVANDWHGDDDATRFVHRVHDGACKVSGMVLGPDYDAPHRTHFHVQQAGLGYCR